MHIRELKKQIIEIGRRLWVRGYVAANDGNISVRLDDGSLLATATGVSKGFMTEEMIIRVDKDGAMLDHSTPHKPSSELKMHLEVYEERPDVQAVVHAHPPYSTAFAVAGIPLDRCVLPESVLVLGSVPIAEYALPSTDEVPEKIRPYLKDFEAILLANHGALTMGNDLMSAYFKMETLEHTAHIIWNAVQLGNVNVLPQAEAERLMTLRAKFNLPQRAASCEAMPYSINQPKIKANPDSLKTSASADADEALVRAITRQVLEALKKKQD